MKVGLSLTLLLSAAEAALAVAADAAPEGVPVARDAGEADGPVLEKRQCHRNGCRCRSGTRQGTYCGRCAVVTNVGHGASNRDIFECNSSGGCCHYGRSSHCAAAHWHSWCPRPPR
ncbi:hypothetical protein CDD83_8193 [Cordyceps sp. RAO-2017]|nr:hypothetical protein CDD83_8193 [Cordyceps sp. RAO-2017]